MKHLLLINAHHFYEKISEGRLNRTMAGVIKDEMEKRGYEVFTAGMFRGSFLSGDGRTRDDPSKQYGSGGLMQGKKYMLSLTWNAPQAAFGDKDQVLFAGKTVDDVFVANTANYAFCGAEVLPSFSCHDVMKAPDIDGDIARLRAHLVMIAGPAQ